MTLNLKHGAAVGQHVASRSTSLLSNIGSLARLAAKADLGDDDFQKTLLLTVLTVGLDIDDMVEALAPAAVKLTKKLGYCSAQKTPREIIQHLLDNGMREKLQALSKIEEAKAESLMEEVREAMQPSPEEILARILEMLAGRDDDDQPAQEPKPALITG